MNDQKTSFLTKIGVFYDGNYFYHVSNYYNFNHLRRSRLSVSGLHEFIRNQVAQEEATDVRLCQIVDAHYFRGRYSAQEATLKGNLLYWERVFDDVLMSEGVVTHYLPLKSRLGKTEEKGIDVWLALEAFELAFYKKFNVLVLVACDGDYVPLVRKVNTLGTRVMILSWDFEYENQDGIKMITRTSQDLLAEASYPLTMHEIIDNKVRKNEALINNLFVPHSVNRTILKADEDNEFHTSEIFKLKEGYGFIKYPPNNVFFHYSTVTGTDFNDLKEGDKVEFTMEKNAEGGLVAKTVKLINSTTPNI